MIVAMLQKFGSSSYHFLTVKDSNSASLRCLKNWKLYLSFLDALIGFMDAKTYSSESSKKLCRNLKKSKGGLKHVPWFLFANVWAFLITFEAQN